MALTKNPGYTPILIAIAVEVKSAFYKMPSGRKSAFVQKLSLGYNRKNTPKGATLIDPTMGRQASVDEALDYVQRAIESDLVPLIAHSAFDAWVLGIPYRRTLAICFCCECCCSIRQGLRLGPPTFWDTVVRVPGLALHVGPACTGCGQCAAVCPVGAISLELGRARVAESCKGCGRCATLCPAGAISLHLDKDADPLGQLEARIERRTSIWPPEPTGDPPARSDQEIQLT
jgi:ferredoxin